MNTSATGGYLQPNPTPSQPLPQNFTLNQFLQAILVGISALPGQFVRPNWQPEPPKQPDIMQDWLAFGVNIITPDANAYVGPDPTVEINPPMVTLRHEQLEVELSIYGPKAVETAGLIRDGFQIQENLAVLTSGKMGFVSTSEGRHLPELINERWFNKVVMSVFLRREVQRDYPSILTILSAGGTIYANNAGDEVLTVPLAVSE